MENKSRRKSLEICHNEPFNGCGCENPLEHAFLGCEGERVYLNALDDLTEGLPHVINATAGAVIVHRNDQYLPFPTGAPTDTWALFAGETVDEVREHRRDLEAHMNSHDGGHVRIGADTYRFTVLTGSASQLLRDHSPLTPAFAEMLTALSDADGCFLLTALDEARVPNTGTQGTNEITEAEAEEPRWLSDLPRRQVQEALIALAALPACRRERALEELAAAVTWDQVVNRT